MSHATELTRLAVAERTQRARTSALIILAYAAAVYLFFLAVLGYAAGFFAGFGVPKGIGQGTRAAVPAAVAIDLLLLLLFAVQHSVMACTSFKRRWTRIVPEPAERATFVLAASLLLALLFWLWRPVGGPSGTCRDRAPTRCGPCMRLAGRWLLSPPSWSATPTCSGCGRPGCMRGASGTARRCSLSAACTGGSASPDGRFMVIFWAAPVMTAGHLLLAAAATGYIGVGIAFEEHDLIQSLGATYTAYRDRVPALIPQLSLRRHSPGS
jgi:protein-S-isoprenylcysteine O-methyltransferase Ste14